jgi:hypothetical protein
VPTIDENLQTKTSFSVGSALTLLLSKIDERWGTKSLVKPQGQGSMITNTDRVLLVGIMDIAVVLITTNELETNMVRLVSKKV